MNGLPRSLLFACTRNAIRSPMAEALTKRWLGSGIFIESAGVEPAIVNPFAVVVMAEVGVDIRSHRATTFEELSGRPFDLIVALSESAYLASKAHAAGAAAAVEHWNVPDPTLHEGSREQRLMAFRSVRCELEARICRRFPNAPVSG